MIEGDAEPHEASLAGDRRDDGARDVDAASPANGSSASGDPPTRAWLAGRDAHVDPAELIAEAERAVKGRYRIEHLAGAGGMSRVFSAREAETGRHVAVTLLRVRDPSPQLDPSLKLHHRLVNEAQSMSRLDHPNLCKVRDVSIQGEIPYLVMDWADGAPLRSAWRKQDRRQRMSLFLKIVDAIANAHARGVVHGDIKPDNILVSRKGEPTIVDFGLARSERDGPMGLATPGGTPGYAAPECFQRHTRVDAAIDVFSLGVLLFELLTDQTPWPNDLAPALLIEQMRKSDPPLPEQFVPNTPPDLQRICLAALERDPADRYPSAEQMAADLRRSLRRETVSARPTILVRRFDAQVTRTIDATREWLRLGLISPESAGTLLARLNGMARADSPWVADARRVSWSQAALQAGAWAAIVGILVGLGLSGSLAGTLGVQAAAWIVVLGLTGVGVVLARRGQARVGAGMLWASVFAAPAAAWLTADRVLGLGGAALLPESIGVWLGEFLGGPVAGPSDLQIAVVAGVGVVSASVARWAARSSLFAFTAFAFAFVMWMALGSAAGASPAVLVLFFGMCSVALGLTLDWYEQAIEAEGTAARNRPRDARVVLGAAGLCVLTGAPACAMLFPGPVATWADAPAAAVTALGAGFGAMAAVPVALAWFVSRRTTPVRNAVSAVARSMSALQVLAALALLEYGAVLGAPLGPAAVWFWGLLAASVVTGVVAVRMKWRFVLVVAQAGLALWMVRLFAEAPDAGSALLRAAAVVAGGVAAMVLAWRIPIWRERRRLRRWAERRRRLSLEPPSATWN